MEPQGEDGLTPPVDLSHYFSTATKRRVGSKVKQFYKYFQIPGIAQLAGGLPDYNFFPFDTLEASTALPNRYEHATSTASGSSSAKAGSAGGPRPSNPQAARLVVPKDSGAPNLLREIDIKTALQYGTAQGYPPLFAWLQNFTRKHMHPNVPYRDGPDVILTCGNTDGFSKVLEAFSEVWIEGRDPVEAKAGILCEEFCFSLPMTGARPRGMNLVPVAVDAQGMRAHGPGGLEDVLENWDPARGRRPHLVYMVSMGHNPTGGVQSMERRKAIYELCVRYDIIIIEDEPYWYLQYPERDGDDGKQQPMHTLADGQKSSGFPFLDSLVPSYLSIDYQGRVARLDTFSKTVAPGCRLGWVTAQPALIERLERITEGTTQQPSGFVQSMIAELLMGRDGRILDAPAADGAVHRRAPHRADADAWDTSGWVLWLEGLRNNYQRRMEIMCRGLTEGQYLVKSGRRPSLSQLTLGDNDGSNDDDDDTTTTTTTSDDEWGVIERTQMYRFNRPAGGMFAWIEMELGSHPLARRVAGPRLATAMWVLLTQKPYLVLVGTGSMFSPTDEIRESRGWRFFRLCFAAVDDETVRRASSAFAAGAAAFWRIKDEAEIDRLVEELGDDGPLLNEQFDNAAGQWAGVPGFC